MGEVNLFVNGKTYGVDCDDGQESRVAELGKFVDMKLREMVGSGATGNEAHTMLLTSLVLADEIYELREAMSHYQKMAGNPARGATRQNDMPPEEEQQIAEAIEHLALRIGSIAERLGTVQ